MSLSWCRHTMYIISDGDNIFVMICICDVSYIKETVLTTITE